MDEIKFAGPVASGAGMAEAVRVLNSGWWTSGPKVRQLEEALGGVACASATAGLFALLHSMGVGPGARVAFSTWTFSSMPMAAWMLGATVDLLDVDETLMVPKRVWERYLRECSPAVVVVTHFGGAIDQNAAQMPWPARCIVIDDAAHSPTLWIRPEMSRYRADFGVLSFYPTKSLPGTEGGMVLAKDDKLMLKWVRSFVHNGIGEPSYDRYTAPGAALHYDVAGPGMKLNMTDVSATLVLDALANFDRHGETRRMLARKYRASVPTPFKVISAHLEEPHHPHLMVVSVPGGERDAVADKLAESGIRTSVHFKPVHMHRFWRGQMIAGRAVLWAAPGPGLSSEAMFERALSLPLHLGMKAGDVGRVCQALAEIVA